ncbi:MAG: toxin-antitoxin system YwqK family antitoxin [Lewinellaceae bacterium]|nr:toxin-antitoxin system YwqK family antitoxin [Lewinellaceae bacterium]
MRRFIFCSLLMAAISGCSHLETIEHKDDNGVLLEKYSRRKDTFAKEGKYTSFYPGGQVFEESFYKNDTLDGERKLFYESGAVQTIEHYSMGQFEGKKQYFYENGQLSNEGEYVANEMTGVWKRWFESGELMEEVHFEKNNENGPFKLYHKTGKPSVEGIYTDGDNEEGEIRKYDENGRLTERMFCHFGACATVWSAEKGDIKIDSARIRHLGDLRKTAEDL